MRLASSNSSLCINILRLTIHKSPENLFSSFNLDTYFPLPYSTLCFFKNLNQQMNPPKRTRTTSPPTTQAQNPHTIPNTPSSSGHNTDADAIVPDADADARAPPPAPASPAPPPTGPPSLPVPVLADEKSETITPPFPWATDRRAAVHSLNYLLENEIVTITGQLHCKNCKCIFNEDVDLKEAIKDLSSFIQYEKASMDDMEDKAPGYWLNPEIQCQSCEKEASIVPFYIEDTRKRDINWLFLFFTELLGCCDLGQLKYYLKHNNITISQSEDKPRVLYATYMGLYKQIVPDESILESI